MVLSRVFALFHPSRPKLYTKEITKPYSYSSDRVTWLLTISAGAFVKYCCIGQSVGIKGDHANEYNKVEFGIAHLWIVIVHESQEWAMGVCVCPRANKLDRLHNRSSS